MLTHKPEEIVIQKTWELWPHLPKHTKKQAQNHKELRGFLLLLIHSFSIKKILEI